MDCELCYFSGWTKNETLVFKEERNINVNSLCGHSFCNKCLYTLITSEIVSFNNNSLSNKEKCPYPFKICNYQLDESIQNKFSNPGYKFICTECEQINFVKNPKNSWTCLNCKRFSVCGVCDEIDVCKCNQNVSKKEFSRLFFNFHGMPIRKHLITKEMISDLKNDIENNHMKCPTCQITFHKTSACNEIYHCGKLRICNICRYKSYPWEKGIELEHWKECKRWDNEISGYNCKEECTGSCEEHSCSFINLNFKEKKCTDRICYEHTISLEMIIKFRKFYSMKYLEKEFK